MIEFNYVKDAKDGTFQITIWGLKRVQVNDIIGKIQKYMEEASDND